MGRAEIVLSVDALRKSYGPVRAVDGISFEVFRGEIFGMVGPNGAGKTTTIECLEGLRQPDEGEISVLGLNPARQRTELMQRIGVQLQQSALPHHLKVLEALDLFRSFYRKQADPRHLLETLGLRDSRHRKFGQLSGGQKQRLFIALALINDPEIVFLDELTTGLDPQARRAMWNLVRQMKQDGKTVFLTTHYMEEAQQLCDRVAIIDRGRIVALDTPEHLIQQLKARTRVVFQPAENFPLNHFKKAFSSLHIEHTDDRVIVLGEGNRFVVDVVRFLVENNIVFQNLKVEYPNLEDVFLALTGHQMRD